MKTCYTCGETKSKTEFSKDKYKKDGRRSSCKDCYNIKGKENYWKDPEKARERTRRNRARYKEEDPDKVKLADRNQKLKRAYGITHDEYLSMLEKQDYKCACCGKDNKDAGAKGLVIDHNHTTGKVRELLCTQCNTALGLLKEDELIIDSLLDYVRKHNG